MAQRALQRPIGESFFGHLLSSEHALTGPASLRRERDLQACLICHELRDALTHIYRLNEPVLSVLADG